MIELIMYSKPECHLCEGLQEKLNQVTSVAFELEIRDILSNEEWLERYQYEIPILCVKLPTGEKELPRFSPRGSVEQLESFLHQFLLS